MDHMHEKYEQLLSALRAYGGAAAAFSGGVDSALLLRAAHDALGDRVLAVTAASAAFPAGETEEAVRFCQEQGIRQTVFRFEALDLPDFRENPPDRCYHCKRALFGQIFEIARRHGLPVVIEGTNADDDGDFRPGRRALRELGAESPLREAGLGKADIRALSRELGLPTAEKPSLACLASRFPYGEPITGAKLAAVDSGEQFLFRLGLAQARLRVHGNLARIEALPEQFPLLWDHRAAVTEHLRALGFAYVTVDLQGYRTGSMNETLSAVEMESVEAQKAGLS